MINIGAAWGKDKYLFQVENAKKTSFQKMWWQMRQWLIFLAFLAEH